MDSLANLIETFATNELVKGRTEFRYIGENLVSDSVHKNNIGVPNFGT